MKKNIILFLCLSLAHIALYAQTGKGRLEKRSDSLPEQIDSTQFDDLSNDMADDLPTIAINEDELNANSEGSVSSLLTAGRDPFYSAASFNFSALHFRIRGYDNSWNDTYINGLPLNGLDNGYAPFGLWRGLSKMMRGRENVQGIEANNFAFGNIGLNTNIDMSAGSQWQQTNINYTNSNRNYHHRIFLSHSSGFDENGWAYSIAATGSFAKEGYVQGTYDNSYSFYAAVDKKINLKNKLSFISFYAPSEYARQTASVQEAMDYAGSNFYNPSWGYQNGKVRSANIAKAKQPVFILSFENQPNNQSNWQTSAGYFFGARSTTNLEWYNAPDPRPDYYRYLPSYYATTDPAQAAALSELIKSNPDLLQINWDNLYNVNRSAATTIQNAGGIAGNNVTGNISRYILGSRVVYTKHAMFSSTYHTRISTQFSMAGGVNYAWQNNHYYQQVVDLLGGDFWLNVNQYAEQDFPNNSSIQYNLDKPNELEKDGDHYGYDYDLTYSTAAAWWQAKLNLKHFDLFWASQFSYASFFRTGNLRNGLFPNDSYGKSSKQQFTNHSNKAGVTYKLNGRNYFYLHAGYSTLAPKADAAYVSPRTRNTLQDNVKSEDIQTLEGGYNLNAPKIKLRVTGFFTKSQNGIDVLSFYDDQYQNYVNYALSGISKLYFGGEMGAEIKLTSALSMNAAASVGRYYYDSRQNAVVTVDNSAETLAAQTVYVKNYRIPSTPQEAYSLGLFYRSPKYWFAGLTGNYFSNTWLSINPLRRTSDAVIDVNLEENAATYQSILQQQKMDNAYTLDFFAGWSKKLKHTQIDKSPSILCLRLV